MQFFSSENQFNNIYKLKRGIKISYENDGESKYHIYGIGNRIEQIIANLLDNAISFSTDNQDVTIKVSKLNDKKVMVTILDEGQGFKENDTNKIKIFKILNKFKFKSYFTIVGDYKAWVKNKLPFWKGEYTFSKAFGEWVEKSSNIKNIFPNELKKIHRALK